MSDAQLYFAYCTLIGRTAMTKLCPSARPIVVAHLPEHRMGFARYGAAPGEGGCTFVPAAGEAMFGVVYRLLEAELAALGAVAGVPRGWYERVGVTVLDPLDQGIEAMTYRIPAPLGPYAPPPDYTAGIVAGAREMSLPEAYARRLEAIIAAGG
ncbi:MAG TPA: gamma-glutamylcyclotransferase family protein [Stellaceae bacterium]|nr:gamma-glutamylcyclotransferase family protein [Stellaceae bacterium]